MADEPGQDPKTPTPGQDPKIDPTVAPPAGGGQDPKPEPKTFTEDYVKQLRDEAAAHRVKAAELAAELKKRQDADLTEQERIAKERDELKAALEKQAAELRQERARVAITSEAAKIGVKPELAYKLLSADVQFDADGNPQGVQKAVADLVAANPELVPKGGPQAGPANPARGSEPDDPIARAEARRKQECAAANIHDPLRGGGVRWIAGKYGPDSPLLPDGSPPRQ